MKKKIQKNDIFFILVILFGLLLHMIGILCYPEGDETFYFSVPLRLINGDSLIQDEWHLTQFSSLFLYLPVYLWMKIKGSTDGIIVFMRVLYLLIHTVTSLGIYKFFRKYGICACAAVAIFYTQVPYTNLTVCYVSLFALFFILLTMLLFMIYNKQNNYLFVCVGICYGACCVCSPLTCFFYPIYIAFCMIWHKKRTVRVKGDKKLTNTTVRTDKNNLIEQKTPDSTKENLNIFFNTKAVLLFSAGIGIVAAISILFYIATGGMLTAIFDNFKYMLSSSEYSVYFFQKLVKIVESYNKLTFNLPFLLPLLFIFLFFDKKRQNLAHRLIYLIWSFALCVMFVICMLLSIKKEDSVMALVLPIALFSTVCYILTENKNRAMFYCMWVPGAIGAVGQFLSSLTIYAALGFAVIPCALVGMVFVSDFVKELRADFGSHKKDRKRKSKFCAGIVLISFSIQIFLNCFVYLYFSLYESDMLNFNSEIVCVSEGPLAGVYASKRKYTDYSKTIDDLNVIKSLSTPEDPVLILSNETWEYLYIDRPFAMYSAFYLSAGFEPLKQYYDMNPEKAPKYIYIGVKNKITSEEMELKKMFRCKKTTLSNGILLTVKD